METQFQELQDSFQSEGCHQQFVCLHSKANLCFDILCRLFRKSYKNSGGLKIGHINWLGEKKVTEELALFWKWSGNIWVIFAQPIFSEPIYI